MLALSGGVRPAERYYPFAGTGTTGRGADRLGRNAVLLELNRDYAVAAKRCIENDAPLFATVE